MNSVSVNRFNTRDLCSRNPAGLYPIQGGKGRQVRLTQPASGPEIELSRFETQTPKRRIQKWKPMLEPDSPLDLIGKLPSGWDGRDSEPIAPVVLQKAEQLRSRLLKLRLPTYLQMTIRPTPSGAVCFTWTNQSADTLFKIKIEPPEEFLALSWAGYKQGLFTEEGYGTSVEEALNAAKQFLLQP